MPRELFADIVVALTTFVIYVLVAALTFAVLYFALGRLLSWLFWWLLLYRARLRREVVSERRSITLRHLSSSLMSALAVILTLIFILGQFIAPGTLATTIGLFSAGIGFAARPFISDLLGGIVLLFEDQFALGEKVEIGDRNVVGVVEKVSLRTTHIRGELGELWIVPNGDVRTIRNFTRGSFSPASIKLTVPTARLDDAIDILRVIAADPGPNVVETPEIISEEGQIGETTDLLLNVKAAYSHGPEVRRDLLSRLKDALIEGRIIAHAQPHDQPVDGDRRQQVRQEL